MNSQTKKLTAIGMLCALSYAAVVFCRIPLVLFLKYEPKDVIITIGGFLFGPLTSFLISAVVSFVEFVTISNDGPIGLIMNVIATCSFACTAAFIYKRKRTIKGAVIGLVAGIAAMTAMMLLWNYIITPLYLLVPREEVVKLLIPAFLPFNLIKGSLNAAITLLLYRPLTTALRHARLLPETGSHGQKKAYLGVILVSALVIISCVLFAMAIRGIF